MTQPFELPGDSREPHARKEGWSAGPASSPCGGAPLDPEKHRILARNLHDVRRTVASAARRVGRDPAEVSLLAVTKYVGPDLVRGLHALGLRAFAESTVQGLASKVTALGDLEGATWHLVGHLQRNKVSRALRMVSSIHSVDSERLLREIGEQACRLGVPVPRLWIEVNASGEAQKTGLPPALLEPLLGLARDGDLLPRPDGAPPGFTPVVGLMTMAPLGASPESARPAFRALRELRDGCARKGLIAVSSGLSMGMSGDFEVAVEEGSTLVRVGSRLFEGLMEKE